MSYCIGPVETLHSSPYRESNEFFESFNLNRLFNDTIMTPIKPGTIIENIESSKKALTPLSFLAINRIMGSPDGASTIDTTSCFSITEFGTDEFALKIQTCSTSCDDDAPAVGLARAQSTPVTINNALRDKVPKKIEINLFDILKHELIDLNNEEDFPDFDCDIETPISSKKKRSSFGVSERKTIDEVPPRSIAAYINHSHVDSKLSDTLIEVHARIRLQVKTKETNPIKKIIMDQSYQMF